MIFALSGTAHQTADFLHSHGLPAKDYRHVYESRDLQGYRSCVLIRYGTWGHRKDADEIIHYARALDFIIVDAAE